jgi:Ca2+-binding RTX toxin-like protein
MSSTPLLPNPEMIDIEERVLDNTAQSQTGTTGNDVVSLGIADDTFYSANPAGTLSTSTGSDTLNGGGGENTLSYEGEGGLDTNGAFNTTIGVQANLTSSAINGISAGTVQKAKGGTDTVANFQNLIGSAFDDEIYVSGGSVADRSGNDTVIGGSNSTVFQSGSGDDVYQGNGILDVLRYDTDTTTTDITPYLFLDLDLDGAGSGVAQDPWGDIDTFSGIEIFYGSDSDDIMYGHDGDDTFFGLEGDDELYGGAGSDSLDGGDGDDRLNPGNSNHYDILRPGKGEDLINFRDITAVDANGNANLAQAKIAHDDLDAAISVEIFGIAGTGEILKGTNGITDLSNSKKIMNAGGLIIEGTNFDDLFEVEVSNGGLLTLNPGDGQDTIQAYEHSGWLALDYLNSDVSSGITADLTRIGDGTLPAILNDGFGNVDYIVEDGDIQFLRGTDLADNITGSANAETFELRIGHDTLDGGGGHDTLRYDSPYVALSDSLFIGVDGITADLGAGTISGAWNSQSFLHHVSNVESFYGSDREDMIDASGLTYAVELYGGLSNDTLIGGSDDDLLQDHHGENSFSGGAGKDVFEIGRGNSTINGGADFDTVELSDALSGAIYVTYGSQGTTDIEARFSQSASSSVLYTAETTNVERVKLDVAAQVNAIGGDANDVLSLSSLPETLTFDGGDGNDTLQVHELTLDGDTSFGMLRSEFSDLIDVTILADGWLEFRQISDGTLLMSLTNVEKIHFVDKTVSLTEVVTGLPTTVTGTDGNDEITGAFGNEIITALDGNDTIRDDGDGGEDTFSGGDGVDTLITDATELAEDGKHNDSIILFDLDAGEHGRLDNDDGAFELVSRDRLEDIENFILIGDLDAEVTGDENDNVLTTDSGSDTILGDDGNDTLSDGTGNDYVSGDDGDDRLIAGTGADTFDGGAGIDTLVVDTTGGTPGSFVAQVNLLTGDMGGKGYAANRDQLIDLEHVEYHGPIDVELTGNDLNNILSAGSGNDTITGGAGNDDLSGGLGDDILIIAGNLRQNGALSVSIDVFDDHLVVSGADGQDTISNDIETIQFDDESLSYTDLTTAGDPSGPTTLSGSLGDDILQGTADAEVIQANAGDDFITTGGGSDTIDGGAGHDVLVLSDLADTPGRPTDAFRMEIYMQEGSAQSFDGSQVISFINIEEIHTTNLGDRVIGTDDADTMIGGDGNDSIEAGTGVDFVEGGKGDDHVFGGGGGDQLRGGDGNDMIDAMNGNDYVYGGVGDDMLIGSGGRDRLRGNKGNDTMEGGRHNDFLQGGDGADVFVFNTNEGAWGKDFIKDFEVGVDKVIVEGFTSDDVVWKNTKDGASVLAIFKNGGKIVFNNLDREDLNDFAGWDFIG